MEDATDLVDLKDGVPLKNGVDPVDPKDAIEDANQDADQDIIKC